MHSGALSSVLGDVPVNILKWARSHFQMHESVEIYVRCEKTMSHSDHMNGNLSEIGN